MSDPVHIATMVTVLLWLLGLSFWAGRVSERVQHQDDWREEHIAEHAAIDANRREDLKAIYEKIDNLWGQKFGGGKC